LSRPLTHLIILTLLAACSSLPPEPAQVTSQRTLAHTQLQAARKEAARANWSAALQRLSEAHRIALAVDDNPLLVETHLAHANIHQSTGNPQAALQDIESAQQAALEAEDSQLLALVAVHRARCQLLSSPDPTAIAPSVVSEVERQLPQLQSNPLRAAAAHITLALAHKTLGNHAAAVANIHAALSIHLQDNHLEAAAYDNYLLASGHSVQGNHSRALQAIQDAINLDRRAENSHGLGMDYRARARIHARAGDAARAHADYRHSAAIFRAAGIEEEALRSEEATAHIQD
jgi:Tfp pilus assembly protein PilF